MDSLCFSDENHTKYHGKRTSLTQGISIPYVKVVPFTRLFTTHLFLNGTVSAYVITRWAWVCRGGYVRNHCALIFVKCVVVFIIKYSLSMSHSVVRWAERFAEQQWEILNTMWTTHTDRHVDEPRPRSTIDLREREMRIERLMRNTKWDEL